MEMGAQGKRRFVAAPIELFWNRYCRLLPHHRHAYEIIRQGTPCNLYFGTKTLEILAWSMPFFQQEHVQRLQTKLCQWILSGEHGDPRVRR